MRTAFVIALLCLSAALPAGAADCGRALNQMAANDCAAQAATADAALNRAWAEVQGALKGGPAAGPLREAQRSWIAYRDLACKAEAAVYQGGSIAPMIRSLCVERLTRARTADLTAMLN